MHHSNLQTKNSEQSYHIKRLTIDRRRNQRVQVNLLGRFMNSSKEEFPCRLLNVSPGGCAMLSNEEIEPQEKVIAYFDHLGRVEGVIARIFEGGFGLKFQANLYKKEKLAEKLIWLANRKVLDLEDDRRHTRITPNGSLTKLQFNNGQNRMCRLLDVSISGASVAIDDKPELGIELIIGKMKGRVVRHHNQGVGIEFTDIQNPSAIRKAFS